MEDRRMDTENERRGLELYVRSLSPAGARTRQEAVIERLAALAEREVIAGYDVHVWGTGIRPASPAARTASGRFVLERLPRSTSGPRATKRLWERSKRTRSPRRSPGRRTPSGRFRSWRSRFSRTRPFGMSRPAARTAKPARSRTASTRSRPVNRSPVRANRRRFQWVQRRRSRRT